METKLSIITVNRNNAEGLRKTIESVFQQTLSNFEYIIVDGASTDNSNDVVSDKCLMINGETILNGVRVKCISEPDSGIYEAMNKGIKIACGEYLLFLNSGDFLLKDDVLQKVFKPVHTADILSAGCNVSEKGKVVWTSNPPLNITFGTLYKVGLAHQSTFIKRSMFATLGFYREDFKYNSDIDFWYRSIILHEATTEKVDLIVSDYNLDGISSKEYQTEEYKNEIKEILSQANFNKFVADYESWEQEKQSMEIFYWAKQNKGLTIIIKLLYKLTVWMNKKK